MGKSFFLPISVYAREEKLEEVLNPRQNMWHNKSNKKVCSALKDKFEIPRYAVAAQTQFKCSFWWIVLVWLVQTAVVFAVATKTKERKSWKTLVSINKCRFLLCTQSRVLVCQYFHKINILSNTEKVEFVCRYVDVIKRICRLQY